MPDLDEIIGNAVVDAGLAETDDTGELVGTDETPVEETHEETPVTTTEEEETTEAELDADGKPKEKEAPAPEGDDLDRELQGLGIQPKDARGGESRIRYSRIRKIWDNWGKKLRAELSDQHGKAVKDLESKIQTSAQRLEYMDNVEKLIKTDKRRYLDLLVMADPGFKEFLNPALYGGGGGAGGGSAAPISADEKMPAPDAKFEDGSTGYSPEGLQKVLEWNTQRTLKVAEKHFAERYGKPLETLTTQQRTETARQMHATRVRENVERAKQVYGKIFTDDFGELGAVKADSAVLKVLQDNPKMNFIDACAIALIPKLQADQNKIRESVLAELKERPGAARSAAPVASKASAATTPDTVEGIIAGEMRKAGML